MLSSNRITKDQARRLVEGCFADLKNPAEHGFVPETSRPDIEIAEQRDLSHDFIRRRLEHIANQSYPADVRVHAMVIARKAGISFRDQPASVQLDLMEGVARAEIERTRLQLFRLEDRLSPFAGFDPLFVPTNTAAATTSSAPANVETPSAGLTLGQLVETYLAFGTSQWVSKTIASRTRQLRLLTDFLGQDTPLAVISTDRVRAYRDALKTLRAKKYSVSGLTFHQKLTADAAKQISPKTVLLTFESAKCLFRWAKEEGHMAANPAADLKVKLPPTKTQDARKPLSADDVPLSFHPAATRDLGLVTPRSVG